MRIRSWIVGMVLAGSVLMEKGLSIEVSTEIRSELILFEAQQPG